MIFVSEELRRIAVHGNVTFGGMNKVFFVRSIAKKKFR